MSMVGADLGGLSALATRFGNAGEAFSEQSSRIATEVRVALDEFVVAMEALKKEAVGLSTDISGQMTTLNSQAHATTWTGSNSEKMMVAVDALDDEIVRIKLAIDGFVDEASSVVNGTLTTGMDALASHAEKSGHAALDIAVGFNGKVAKQRLSFDNAMNG